MEFLADTSRILEFGKPCRSRCRDVTRQLSLRIYSRFSLKPFCVDHINVDVCMCVAMAMPSRIDAGQLKFGSL